MTLSGSTSVRNQRGFIVSELLALAIIALSVVGIVAASKAGFDMFKFYKNQAAMMERESYLVAALQSDLTLTALKAQLQGGAIVDGTPIVYEGQTLARQNQTILLDENQVECPTGAPAGCGAVSVDFSVRCSLIDSRNQCFAAYRLTSLQKEVVPFGAPVRAGGGFDPALDYNVAIPFEITSRTLSAECDPAQDMFASGFDKATGQMFCVKRPSVINCGANQVAREMYYDRTTQSMQLVCLPLRAAQCPPNYVLQSVTGNSLYPSSTTTSGTCVFAAQYDSVPIRNIPAPAASIVGTFCPLHYKMAYSCELTPATSSNGMCWDLCEKTTSDGQTYTGYCGNPSSPNTGGRTANLSPSGRSLDCHVDFPGSQPCGATWDAKVALAGTCYVDPAVNPQTTGAY